VPETAYRFESCRGHFLAAAFAAWRRWAAGLGLCGVACATPPRLALARRRNPLAKSVAFNRSVALSMEDRAAQVGRRVVFAPVAQLDRASDYGSEGWGFESSRAHSEAVSVVRRARSSVG
jgi:hypothetical protein